MTRRTTPRPGIRQAEISELVSKRGEMSVEALAERFDTSPETIRRDLTALADDGKIRKIHGGARAMDALGEGEFGARMRRNALAKRLIAEKLKNVVSPGQTLFMDTGSTTLFCAEVLARVKHLTIVTNSTRIAKTFAAGKGNADIYLLGGLYRGDNAQTVGTKAVCDVADYRADMAIITVGGLDKTGAMDFSCREAEIARAMIGASEKTCIVADHSKIDQKATFRLCGLEDVDCLVVDRAPRADVARSLAAANVDVV